MSKKLLILSSIFIFSCSVNSNETFSNETILAQNSKNNSVSYVQDEFIIKLNKGIKPEEYAKTNNLKLVSNIGLDMYVFKGNSDLELLKRDNKVKWVEKNKIINLPKLKSEPFIDNIKNHKRGVTNDPYLDIQYGISITGTDKAWSVQKGNPKVVVAIIDSGIDATHPEFQGQLVKGMDFTVKPPKEGGDYDKYGHGTHVAGVVAAKADNGIGISGVAPNCKLMPVKIFNDWGQSTEGASTQAVIWAVDNGAKVINASWGSPLPGEAFHEAVKYALEKDVVFVAAVGNSGNNDPDTKPYPGASEGVIGVSATTDIDGWASFSTYGDQVDLGAPGKAILSTYPLALGNGYRIMEGTSMAAPLVSGAAALVRSQFPNFTQAQVKERLENTAKDTVMTGKDQYVGFGRVDVAKAIISQ
ncbi:MAG: S8 family serine peptidase [Candidatus Sericytochromatia bacterium]